MNRIKVKDIPTRFMRRYCIVLLGTLIIPALTGDCALELILSGWRKMTASLRDDGGEMLATAVECWCQ